MKPKKAPNRSAPLEIALKPDSLAFALLGAATTIAEVIAGRNLNEALAHAWQAYPALAPAARGALQDLSYSALRRFGRGDFFLGRLMDSPLRDRQIRALLLAALDRLEARPEQAHTTVDQAVEAAGLLAAGKYRALVNAVLRNFLRRSAPLLAEAQANEVASLCHPRWWLMHLKRAWPADWQAIAAAGNSHPPMTLRVNCRRTTPAAYRAALKTEGIAARALDGAALLLERPVGVDKLPGFADGLCSVQDAAAQCAAPLLDLADGMRVLDACAAPGGKTAHVLELADADVLALDADPERVQRVRENLLRLGLPGATVRSADCRDLASWWDGRAFDRILADVPCSASGVVRRHPDIKWLRREADIAKFARTQAEILDALWRVLAPGGKLLYVTCSLFPQENGIQVAAFTARHGDCLRLPIGNAPESQLLPSDEHDGFYLAQLAKRD